MGQAWGHVCVMESSRSAWSTVYMGPQWVVGGSLVTARAAVETSQCERAMEGAVWGACRDQSSRDFLVNMVSFYYSGHDIRCSKSVEPLPAPMPVVEHAGDVEVGGLHLFEVHVSTLLGGGGVIIVILVVILLTWCCLRGLLQRCLVNMCVICCSKRRVGGAGQGGGLGEEADVENQGSGGADKGQGQMVA